MLSIFVLIALLLCSTRTTFINIEEAGPKLAADYILDALDPNIKPCDDIYGFMCGKWLEKVNGANETHLWFEDNRVLNATETVLLKAVEDINPDDPSTPKYKIWLRTYFYQCMKTKPSLNISVPQAYEGMSRMIGPPPLFSQNKTAHDELVKRNVWHLMGEFQRDIANSIFFRITVVNDATYYKNGRPILYFEPPPLDWFTDINATHAKAFVDQFAHIMKFDVDENEVNKRVDDVIQFSKELKALVNASQFNERANEVIYINKTQLYAVNPNIWTEYFKGLFTPEQLNAFNNLDTRYQARNRKYFKDLNQFVKQHDIETIFNFVFGKAMYTTVIVPEGRERMIVCLKSMKSVHRPASAKVIMDYLKQNPEDWKDDIDIIYDNILSAFKQQVQRVDWFTAAEKAAIIKKANYITFINPIPDWFLSDAEIERRTAEFDPNKGFYDNSLNTEKREVELEMERLLTGQVASSSISLNDEMSYDDMHIKLSFGIILPPVYHIDYPLNIKYAILGRKLAKLLLQGFALNRVWENPPGFNRWISDANVENIQKAADCIHEQFIKMECSNGKPCKVHDHSWDGSHYVYLREVDSLRIAGAAYKVANQNASYVAGVLPGLESYTGDQTFFMAVGRKLCETFVEDWEQEGGGSRTQTRLVKIFRNCPCYAKTFHCPQNSPVVVDRPCGVLGT